MASASRRRICSRGRPRPNKSAPCRPPRPGGSPGSRARTSRSQRTSRRCTQAVKSGARGFGEMKLHLATDSAEFRRAYALAAELNVPILIHFQEVDHFPERRHLELGIRDEVRVDPEGVPEDDVHRPRRRVLGQRQRRLPQRVGVPVRADRARRRHRSAARRLSRTCTAIWPRIPATTCCRAMPSSRATSCAAIRTSCSSGAIAVARMAAAAASARRTIPRPRGWQGNASRGETLTVLQRSTTRERLSQDRVGQRPQAAEGPGQRIVDAKTGDTRRTASSRLDVAFGSHDQLALPRVVREEQRRVTLGVRGDVVHRHQAGFDVRSTSDQHAFDRPATPPWRCRCCQSSG